MLTHLTKLFDRDLTRLSNELMAYQEEEDIWIIKGDITNSAGNITLHILGNLNHFVGTVLGNTEYVRKRDDEFSEKNVPRSRLLEEIKSANEMIKVTLSKMKYADLDKSYPVDVFEHEMKTEYFLIHLFGHLNYHLGQINYHRRIINS
ncbi:DUF1572 family protein [Bacteroidota bacterium]